MSDKKLTGEDLMQLVSEWHDKFGIKTISSEEELSDFFALRTNLFMEEYQEYVKAGYDLVARADAIVDMMYILYGTSDLIIKAIEANRDLHDPIEYAFDPFMDFSFNLTNMLLAEKQNVLIKERLVPLFIEVNRSNHTKADKDGNPIYREDGKLLKGENFEEPDLRKVLFYEEYEFNSAKTK